MEASAEAGEAARENQGDEISEESLYQLYKFSQTHFPGLRQNILNLELPNIVCYSLNIDRECQWVPGCVSEVDNILEIKWR